jgi:hypothetical protein
MMNFFIINLNDNGILLMTYEQIEKKYGIKRNQFKKNVLNLINSGFIKELTECETKNEELYAAILTQDYNKIKEFMGD